jgi:hypothetical protein
MKDQAILRAIAAVESMREDCRWKQQQPGLPRLFVQRWIDSPPKTAQT